jgi:DNA-binding MarR family transcriptional regulator
VVIENLIKEGLVKRNIDINDRRVNIISITDKGRDLMSQIFPEHVENINTIFNVLSTEEKQTLIRLLKKLSGIEPS